MRELDVRKADFDDLSPLTEAFGDRSYFEDRLERQKNELGVLFTAWFDQRLVGDVYLWWQKAEEEPIQQYLPGIPLLTHLEVLPGFRNQGIGTRLIAEAQDYLTSLDHWYIALAARTDNAAAVRLYERLGYRDWGRGEVECYAVRTLPDGVIKRESETCHVLTRRLVRSCYD
jgi:ribosomal protein S18 acetylase RimI-like enzyme